jgi:hypothetical protein
MPIRRLGAAEAYENLKTNVHNAWPRADEPDNRFAHYASPAFTPHFRLEPGQRIFTIGSCFARGIEVALEQRGFDIPTRAFTVDKGEWGGDPTAVLNNYVPQAIAPHIRWAFGHEKFDVDLHCAEVRPGRYIDLQLPMGFRPMPAEAVIARRERLNALYRSLADCTAVFITLGLIEAWFDKKSQSYVNCPPPKSTVKAEGDRFELHVLEYNQVLQSMRDLIALFDQVCKPGYRILLTVSPVPLTATFTDQDVAIANTYSKAVLRAATEAIVAEYDHVEYYPSYETVMLTDRSVAFVDDQIHVNQALVRYNVDRMIRRYVDHGGQETPAEIIARAKAEAKSGLMRAGLKTLQEAHSARPDDPDLTIALADMQLRAGQGKAAETLLLKLIETRESGAARGLLAKYYNDTKRHSEAALHAEAASELGKLSLASSLQRVVAYYHLGRHAEGLALLDKLRFALERKPLIIHWKARFAEKLDRHAEAEAWHREATGIADDRSYKLAFAEFLAARGRWDEVAPLVDAVLLEAPLDAQALRLRAELRQRSGSAPLGAEQAAGRRGASPLRVAQEAAGSLIARWRARR